MSSYKRRDSNGDVTEIRRTGNAKRSLWGFVGGDQYKGTFTDRRGNKTTVGGDSEAEVLRRLRRRR